MKRKRIRHLFEEKIYRFENSNEIERIRTGPQPDRGKKREKRKRPTPEQMRKQNQYNREKKTRRIIKANFKENDYWLTLTYKNGRKTSVEQAKSDKRKFLRYMRREYTKRGEKLKWVGVYERGKRGAVHHHFVINRIPDTDVIVKQAWKQIEGAGRVDMQLLYEDCEFRRLANYIMKAEVMNDKGEPVERGNVTHSKNLVIPEPEVRKTTRKKILDQPVPNPGYYIDTESICQGVNEITGREYLHYIEIRIKGGGG